MSEKEKMLSGKAYLPNTKELINERFHAKELCVEYNSLQPSQMLKKSVLLDRLLGKVGKNPNIEPNFFCDYGYNIEAGDNLYINHNCVMLDCNKITFGDNVFIGPNCGFYCAEHPLDAKTRNSGIEYAFPIKVGHNVWFGGNVTVLGGVTIGDNVVIGAGSVVTKDIPSGVAAVGNPCRILKNIST